MHVFHFCFAKFLCFWFFVLCFGLGFLCVFVGELHLESPKVKSNFVWCRKLHFYFCFKTGVCKLLACV
jgi:hypothetical protein